VYQNIPGTAVLKSTESPTDTKRQPEVGMAVIRLAERRELLTKAVSVLAEKLGPIIRCEDKKVTEANSLKAGCGVPLADALNDIDSGIAYQIHKLMELAERIEL
jgi:hypothetical protein